jgi:hypothetical protein
MWLLGDLVSFLLELWPHGVESRPRANIQTFDLEIPVEFFGAFVRRVLLGVSKPDLKFEYPAFFRPAPSPLQVYADLGPGINQHA